MKKLFYFFVMAAMVLGMASCGQNEPGLEDGVIKGKFSVSADKQVWFSRGNLQYCPANDVWRFAEHQYDTLGVANAKIADTYDGWIDLFGWGTGGKPTNFSEDKEDYDNWVDWGHKPITNGRNTVDMWRTLERSEWVYLMHGRKGADTLFATATVNGVRGMILLPDVWQTPEEIVFTPSTKIQDEDLGCFVWQEQNVRYYNEKERSYEHNIYTAEQWSKMEAKGAVFLPAAGMRWSKSVNVYETEGRGYYWSSTLVENGAYTFYFKPAYILPELTASRVSGIAVRLVQDVK